MTPKIIELNQAPVVLVYLPYQPMQIIYGLDRTKIYYRNEIFGNWIAIKNIPEFDSILGVLSDLTEDQFAECVNKIHFEDGDVYKDYRTNLGLSSAKESFQSLLESENVYTENPYGGKLEPCGCMGPCGIPCAFNEWQEAQSCTIDITRTIILLKK